MFYTPLPEEGLTRVMTILPAGSDGDGTIVTQVSAISLMTRPSPTYDALSYVWGDPTPKSSIVCNKEVVEITESLHGALHCLRRATQERVIWIDQLCINQGDIPERESQVAMMGDIYSKAEEVLIWLGPSDEETSVVWNILYDLGNLRDFEAYEVYNLALDGAPHSKAVSTCTPSQVMSDTKSGSRAIPDLPPGSAPEWKAMERFFQRPWFTRTWTFQEVVLSQKCTVYCGSFSIPWIELSDACKGIEISGFDTFIDHIHTGITTVQVHRMAFRKLKRSALRVLLEANRSRDATEPKDKIFALRGVIHDSVAQCVNVDYGEPLGETYAKAAKLCIEESKALTVLGSVEYRRTQESRDEMPSWVPDWRYKTSVAVDLSMRRLDGSKFFNASSDMHPVLLPHPNNRKLKLKGFVVAELTRFSEVRRHLDFDIYRMKARRFPNDRFHLDKWTAMYERASKQAQFPASSLRKPEQANRIMASLWGKTIDDPLTEAETVEMAYRRTITADLLPRPYSRLNDLETKQSFPAYTAWQYAGFPDPIPAEVLHEHDIYVTKVMSNREFFVAGDGDESYMGICMGVPTDGDRVCILLGGDTPFVLRPKGGGEWQFVAEAYVHGIVDGEAMERTTETGFEFEEFTLV